MTDGLLENIIQLEKKIQGEVAVEQARAAEWQERELAELESSLREERASVEKHFRQLLIEEKAALLHENSEIEANASAWCQRLQCLDDATLGDILKRHLAVILPGGDHDHPHGEG